LSELKVQYILITYIYVASRQRLASRNIFAHRSMKR